MWRWLLDWGWTSRGDHRCGAPGRRTNVVRFAMPRRSARWRRFWPARWLGCRRFEPGSSCRSNCSDRHDWPGAGTGTWWISDGLSLARWLHSNVSPSGGATSHVNRQCPIQSPGQSLGRVRLGATRHRRVVECRFHHRVERITEPGGSGGPDAGVESVAEYSLRHSGDAAAGTGNRRHDRHAGGGCERWLLICHTRATTGDRHADIDERPRQGTTSPNAQTASTNPQPIQPARPSRTIIITTITKEVATRAGPLRSRTLQRRQVRPTRVTIRPWRKSSSFRHHAGVGGLWRRQRHHVDAGSGGVDGAVSRPMSLRREYVHSRIASPCRGPPGFAAASRLPGLRPDHDG